MFTRSGLGRDTGDNGERGVKIPLIHHSDQGDFDDLFGKIIGNIC